jgi:hypothetical protein
LQKSAEPGRCCWCSIVAEASEYRFESAEFGGMRKPTARLIGRPVLVRCISALKGRDDCRCEKRRSIVGAVLGAVTRVVGESGLFAEVGERQAVAVGWPVSLAWAGAVRGSGV